MACQTEASDLPLLTGCPGDNEFFIVGNAVGGKGSGLYARRLYSDIKGCIAAGSIQFTPLQFTIGQGGSPLSAGQTILTITVTNPVENSETIILDNNYMEPNLDDQISYTVSYSSTQIIITFNEGVVDGQKYYIKYAKV